MKHILKCICINKYNYNKIHKYKKHNNVLIAAIDFNLNVILTFIKI